MQENNYLIDGITNKKCIPNSAGPCVLEAESQRVEARLFATHPHKQGDRPENSFCFSAWQQQAQVWFLIPHPWEAHHLLELLERLFHYLIAIELRRFNLLYRRQISPHSAVNKYSKIFIQDQTPWKGMGRFISRLNCRRLLWHPRRYDELTSIPLTLQQRLSTELGANISSFKGIEKISTTQTIKALFALQDDKKVEVWL